jgi:predicted nucleic acid-binding protein
MMQGLVVDSSVWIDYFSRKALSPEKTRLQQWIASEGPTFLCPVVYQEVLQGVRDERAFTRIKADILSYKMVPIDLLVATNYAVDMFRALQKKGVTIRKAADCLIAAYTILGDMTLLHRDNDFTAIAGLFPLKIVKVTTEPPS